MRVAIASDAWVPQVNGVVRTLTTTVGQLLERGYEVDLIVPDQFVTIPMPGYHEIRLALAPRMGTRRSLNAFAPDVVHIVTEGPIGWSARKWCMANNVPFTTAFHTRFPDYAAVRTGLSPEYFWPIMRRFHAPSAAVFVSTKGLRSELASRGIANARIWSRGIDTRQFTPDGPPHPQLQNLPRPLYLSVGRVAAEKNLEAFLKAPVAGTKVVVGDGPDLLALREKYPEAYFMGMLTGDALAMAYRAADVFVFPSKTDTFGLVMIEALACGVPVAGYIVPGPLDIVCADGMGIDGRAAGRIGVLSDDLALAMEQAVELSPSDAVAYGRSFNWESCTDQFVAGLKHALARPAAVIA